MGTPTATRHHMDPAILDDITARLRRCQAVLLDPQTMPQDRQQQPREEHVGRALERLRREREA